MPDLLAQLEAIDAAKPDLWLEYAQIIRRHAKPHKGDAQRLPELMKELDVTTDQVRIHANLVDALPQCVAAINEYNTRYHELHQAATINKWNRIEKLIEDHQADILAIEEAAGPLLAEAKQLQAEADQAKKHVEIVRTEHPFLLDETAHAIVPFNQGQPAQEAQQPAGEDQAGENPASEQAQPETEAIASTEATTGREAQ